jgi:predicted O-linked N-acetylglucosamine transferase (SPINDLY family)
MVRGFIAHLPRDAFEVVVLFLGSHHDEIGEFIRRRADRHLEVPRLLPAARRLIAEQDLDVLLYTDIGMEPVTYSLAFSRLAPAQAAFVGHPLTTGIPTIDYFVSSAWYEPDDADQHYTETLARLNSLHTCYYRPMPTRLVKSRDLFGLSHTDHVYACLQSLFKLHPSFDEMLAGILGSDPRGVLVLLHGRRPRSVEALQHRWATTMPDVVDRIRWLPEREYDAFLQLAAIADVLLDPFPFGGGNTSLEELSLRGTRRDSPLGFPARPCHPGAPSENGRPGHGGRHVSGVC